MLLVLLNFDFITKYNRFSSGVGIILLKKQRLVLTSEFLKVEATDLGHLVFKDFDLLYPKPFLTV